MITTGNIASVEPTDEARTFAVTFHDRHGNLRGPYEYSQDELEAAGVDIPTRAGQVSGGIEMVGFEDLMTSL